MSHEQVQLYQGQKMPGSITEFSSGTRDYSRIDAVVLRWAKNSSGIESATWVVIEGTPTQGTPVAPHVTAGNMNTGDSQDDCLFALARIGYIRGRKCRVV